MNRRWNAKQRAIEEEEKEKGSQYYTESELKSVGMKKHIHYDCDDMDCRICHEDSDGEENSPAY